MVIEKMDAKTRRDDLLLRFLELRLQLLQDKPDFKHVHIENDADDLWLAMTGKEPSHRRPHGYF